MKTAIVDINKKVVVMVYEGPVRQSSIAGVWKDPTKFLHVEIEDAADERYLKVTDALQVVEDEDQKQDELWKAMRAKRDSKLRDCDWTQLPDVKLSVKKLNAWKSYRQALRDLPAETEDPLNPEWPVKPV